MSRSTNSNRKFYVYTTITLAGSAFIAAAFVMPATTALAKSESTQYAAAATSEQGSMAALDYQLAYTLDHTNQAAAVGLAQIYLASGHSNQALKLLSRAGESPYILRLRLQTLTELARYPEAKPIADKMASTLNEPDILLAAAFYSITGDQAQMDAADAHLSSVGALQAMFRLKAGLLPRALELRDLGLPVSSRAMLVKLPPSAPRNLALAEILQQQGDSASLSQAAAYITAAINLDPANIKLRQVLVSVLKAQHKSAAAAAQEVIIQKLSQGNI